MSQRELIHRSGWDHLIICDAARCDVFQEIYPDYLSGDYQSVYNGGCGATIAWFPYIFNDFYDLTYFNGGVPIWVFDWNPHDYDEREHFSEVPHYTEYEWDDEIGTAKPESVSEVVMKYNPDRSIIHYKQPHFPTREYPKASGQSQVADLGHEAALEAYRDNLRWILSHLSEFVYELDGNIVVTSDHGECLGDCGQWLHGTGFDEHEHLVNVPWLEIE